MCFSAQASFAASAILAPAGAYCVGVALRRRLAYLPLALVPVVFSVQQFCEGFVWLGLTREDETLTRFASLVYLAFAMGFWPFWIPFSVLCLEPQPWRRRWLGAATLMGLALGCALYLPMALHHAEWMHPSVAHHSLTYNPNDLPAHHVVSHWYWDAAYGLAVVVPLFLVSARQRFALFRAMVVVSVVVAYFAFHHAFVSVWCFFAAVLSCQLCLIFSGLGMPHSAYSGSESQQLDLTAAS